MRLLLLGVLAGLAAAESGRILIEGHALGSDSVVHSSIDGRSTEAARLAPPGFETAGGTSQPACGASRNMLGVPTDVQRKIDNRGSLGGPRKTCSAFDGCRGGGDYAEKMVSVELAGAGAAGSSAHHAPNASASLGEDATRDREVDTRRGTVPLSDVADLMRALGFYLTEREVNDVAVELRYEAELAGEAVPETVDFDRFLSLYVNRRPPRDVGAEDVRKAFEIVLDGEGDAVSRGSLLEMLKTSGEAMSDEELAAVAKALGGEGASVENLFPPEVTAKSFAEDVLGFLPVDERA